MSKNPYAGVLATLLAVFVIVPSVFFVTPQRAEAQWITFDPTNFVQNTITAIASPITAAATVAKQVNDYVLQPLAFVLSGNLMKMLTASVVGFVIGKANGTGVPQFVVDVRRSMQTVSDGQALAYLRQVSQTNSPFSSSISSALRNNYLQRSSLKGFWDANLCSLSRSSPDVPAYLAGNWSQGGGVAAWFALTTQVQNNPYTLYQASQAQLLSQIGPGVSGATGARSQELSWGSGFMSWCGTSAETTKAAEFSAAAAQTMAATAPKPVDCTPATEPFRDSNGDCYASAADATAADQINNASETLGNTGAGMTATGGIGVNPGDNCTNSDGTPGTIQTPGSTIKATLDKVLGGQQDQINRMGNVGPQINSILKDVASIINTVNFASSLLGGSSGGLSVAGQPSATNNNRSALIQFQPGQDSTGAFTGGYAGTGSTAQVTSSGNTITATGPGTSAYARYVSAWGTISQSAQAASTSIQALANYCTQSANEAKKVYYIPASFVTAARAQAALATSTLKAVVAPVINGAFIAAQTTDPTIAEIASAVNNAQALGTAVADPEGSLNVVAASPKAAMTTTDQMNVLDTNAQNLRSVCVPPPDPSAVGG